MLDDDGDPSPAETLHELLETVAEAFGVDGKVVVEETDETLRGAIDGAHAERLVGDRGSVVDAIQHLAQRIVLRGDEGPRVVVDADGYRGRREAELRSEAERAADTAVAEGRPVALSAMPAAERRFVHEHLRERGGVETHSEGDEPRRRLIVAPL